MASELNVKIVENCLPDDLHTVFVGYSGGLDSHVLLHLLAHSSHHNVCAVHIHHGLQAQADDWAIHCRRQAERLDIQFKLIHVNAHPESGQSPEEAARNARYQAFAGLMQSNDVLMLAQHREDQMETVLLQLFRGAGPAGLAGMPKQKTFAQGLILRPLLDVAQQTLVQYAQKHRLHWVEDPSNQHLDFDRNFLRQQIIPQLKQRWPALDKTVSRSARHCAISDELLLAEVLMRFKAVYDNKLNALSIEGLKDLSPIWREQVLRYWFKQTGLNYPSEKVLQQIQASVIEARQDARPQIKTQRHCLQRYRGKLYLFAESIAVDSNKSIHWRQHDEPLSLDDGRQLTTILSDSGIPVEIWRNASVFVKYRQGGEKIRLPGREGRHELKKLFQEEGVPPWLRDKIPLIYLDGQLAAVADYWISADFYQYQHGNCYQIKFGGK